MRKTTAQRWLLLAILGLAPLACEKSFRLGPQVPPSLTRQPTATFTQTATLTFTSTSAVPLTNTFTSTPSCCSHTFTPTATHTPTASLTFTDTPQFTFTDTETPTETPTDTETVADTPTDSETPTETPTDTETETPTETGTPTDTPTETLTPTITSTQGPPISTVTPVNPSYVNETELITSGGPTGTNDQCMAEIMGTVSSGESRVISGNLLYSGNTVTNYDFVNDDVDTYQFTTGTAGDYQITLDSFDDGSGGNDFDLYLLDPACGTVFGSSVQTGVPVESVTGTGIPAGTTVNLIVVGWQGAPQAPYRLTIQGL